MNNFLIKSARGFVVVVLFALISCSTQEKAPIVLNNDSAQSENDYDSTSSYLQPVGNFKHYKLHEALFTDTVASLAKRYNVSPHDIISLNKLIKPYYLESGEVVKIPVYDSNSGGLSTEGYLKAPSDQQSSAKVPDTSVMEPNKNTVTILPSLPNESLQDYDY